MEILQAYCVELQRVVEIYEAQEAYFAQTERPRKRFDFRCSDLACRAANNPLVVGANYDKDAETSEKFQQPHFKSHDKHPHISSCIWVLGEIRRREQSRLEGQGVEDPKSRRTRSKATNVVDVFEPRQSDTPLDATSAVDRQPASVAERGAPVNNGDSREHTSVTKTSHLEKMVDCWSEMAPQDRRIRRVTAAGQTLTYQQLCLHVTRLSEAENGSRIVYGGARVRKWPEVAPTHYFLDFIDGCERFPDANGGKALMISLPFNRLAKKRRGPLLMHRIEQGLRPKHYLQVYAWGRIVPRERGKGYELKLTALDNLVPKAIESKSRQPQHTAASSATSNVASSSAMHCMGPPLAPVSSPANKPALMALAPITLPPLRPIQQAEYPLEPVALAAPARTSHPAAPPDEQGQPQVAAPSVANPVAHKPAEKVHRARPPSFWYRLSAWWRGFL